MFELVYSFWYFRFGVSREGGMFELVNGLQDFHLKTKKGPALERTPVTGPCGYLECGCLGYPIHEPCFCASQIHVAWKDTGRTDTEANRIVSGRL
jgi:hypothetical protein